MLKKLDWYTIKTFFGPFIFIFSVLFFIFMVQFAWQKMDDFAGKGLGFLDIFKLLFYSGLTVIQLVMPLTVLLSAIMTFGGFGERYELTAMKSTGSSLGRIMLPLFFLICLLSVGLYFFSDRVVPQSQRKAKNMLLNIARTKPAVNFEPGVFIMGIPGFSMKIDDKNGENGEFIKGVFIHQDANAFEDQRTIIAKQGIIKPATDKRFLKLTLFEGFVYDDEVKGLPYDKLTRQPSRQVKFDTLVHYIDVSELVEKAIEEESVTDHYKFMNSIQLMNRVDTLRMENKDFYNQIYRDKASLIFPKLTIDTLNNINKELSTEIKPLEEYSTEEKEKAFQYAISDLERDLDTYHVQKDEIKGRNKFLSRHVLILVRSYSNSLMCIVFFLIGAPLGAIIRKGGVGLPVVVAIIIFINFYVVYMYSENLSNNGIINPYWGAWMPVAVFFPLGLFFTYKAIKDSEIFNIESYLKPFQKLFSIFGAKNKEHARYQ